MERFTGLLGLVVILAFAWLCSTHKREIKLRLLAWGMGLQVLFAVLVLKTDFGLIFKKIGDGVNAMLDYAEVGSQFLFGPLGTKSGSFGVVFAFQVLLDRVGGDPIMLVLGPDGKSVRVFARNIAQSTLEFYGRGATKGGDPWALFESGSLSEWNFDGCALTGELKGQCLAQIDALKDYWFDWDHYHPQSDIYRH